MSTDPSIEPVPAIGGFESIEKALIGLTVLEKLERVERVARSIRVEPSDLDERARRQKQNRNRLMAEFSALPEIPQIDGLSNRDHDQILYGSKS